MYALGEAVGSVQRAPISSDPRKGTVQSDVLSRRPQLALEAIHDHRSGENRRATWSLFSPMSMWTIASGSTPNPWRIRLNAAQLVCDPI